VKIVLQRVRSASVTVDGALIARISAGLLLLVGFGKDDDESALQPMADKVANLRLFADQGGHFHYSILQTGGAALAVPQFTLYADVAKGRRPDFSGAMPPVRARDFFGRFVTALGSAGIGDVAAGRFGASMQVELVNDGPVTLVLEKERHL
jgi:D-tyrosyl-tRNA(Tyr) deacylase